MLRLLLKTVKPLNTSVAYLVVKGYVSCEEENLGIIHANWVDICLVSYSKHVFWVNSTGHGSMTLSAVHFFFLFCSVHRFIAQWERSRSRAFCLPGAVSGWDPVDVVILW